ncbi:DEAD/DEAH box helicase [Candidatus Saccharibacteria bacterium]|nr:DEAD/DEAH box helicase [Candidatus Saccharibacteria bacterium]
MSRNYHSAPRRNNSRRSFGGRNQRRKGPNKQFIHPSKFIQAAKPVEEVKYEPQHTFNDFALNDLLKTNLKAKGFITPSAIQDQSIPYGIEGRDVIGIANTGTGKTAAFALPVINKLMNDRSAKAIILAPTRELAQQIEADCRSFAKGSGLRGALLIGGSSMGKQFKELRSDPNIIIGTPGRVKDHYERGTLPLCDCNIVVLDEVDRMVDMGFIKDIRYLLGEASPKRQSFFYSATLDKNINQLIQSFLTDPVTVSVKTGETGENIEQNIIRYSVKTEKMDKLHDVLISEKVEKTIIFDETQRSVERLNKELRERGFSTDAIHGGKTQGARQRALREFKNSKINVLVATDVAARGIDVSDVTHVINYSTPNAYEDYIHRIGRAGRAGKIGYALTFVSGTPQR